tara:strand:+ start:3247 stop:3441 length:195 start_codon:yes stop_codon:yes gene_type:complete
MPFVNRSPKPTLTPLRLIDWYWNTSRSLTWGSDSTVWSKAGGLTEVMKSVLRNAANTTMTSNDM